MIERPLRNPSLPAFRVGLAAVGLIALLGVVAPGPGSAGGAARVDVDPPAPGTGEMFRIRVAPVGSAGALEAAFAGRAFPLWKGDDGVWEGLGAVDRDEAPGPRELLIVDRSPPGGGEAFQGVAEVTVTARDYPKQHLTVSGNMVTLSPEDRERAAKEAERIRGALTGRSFQKLWGPAVRMPVEAPVSSAFGVGRVYNGEPRGYHGGVDLAAPKGTPVRAALEGTVALAGDFFYTGRTVFLDHGLGLFTAYFHLEDVAVREGARLGSGELVGHVGSTGRSTGPHLHWGVYVAGVRSDPFSFLRLFEDGAGGGEDPPPDIRR